MEYDIAHSPSNASESSSVVSNATNGIEPPRDYLSIKKSKKGTLKQVVPDYQRLKNNYTFLWDMKDNEGYINIVAVMQKYFCKRLVVIGHIIQKIMKTIKYLCLSWHKTYYQHTSMVGRLLIIKILMTLKKTLTNHHIQLVGQIM